MDRSDFITERRAFVNDEYRTHSQSTEGFMIMDGLDFYQFCPEKRIKEVAEAAKRMNEKLKGKDVKHG